MMELAHSLVLNEKAVAQIADAKKPVFVFEWLRFLDKVLVAAQKSDIKGCQKKLVTQLTHQIHQNPGPPTRKLIAKNLAHLFSVGDTFDLFDTVNKCDDILKNKDDSPTYLPTRLATIACIGSMHEKLGRMMGRSYEETVQHLLKSLKNAESQGRMETMLTLEKILAGLGTAAVSCHKDIYKAARNAMMDRSMAVRCAAAKCMMELSKEAPMLYTTELENMASLCFRAFEGSNYDVRCSVALLLGTLVAQCLLNKKISHKPGKYKPLTVEEVLGIMSSGFLRGGIGFSLKGSEMIKGGSVSKEVKVGVTHAYVVFVQTLGGLWLERNLHLLLRHLLVDVGGNPKASSTHVDAVYSRKCINFILRMILGGLLGEKAQISAAKELCQIILKQMNLISADVESKDNSDVSTSHHVLVCALQELSSIVRSLGTSASPLVLEPSTGIIEPVISVLIHPTLSARVSAAWCLRCVAVALPSTLSYLLDRCLERMETLKSSPEATSGYSCALASLIGGVSQCPLGIPHSKGKKIFSTAEDLLRIASQNSRLSLHRTQAGWLLLGALMTLGPSIVKNHLPRMLLLWRNTFPRSAKELESEKARGDAFTWQITLEARAGALASMYSFLLHCQELVNDDVIRRLRAPTDSALIMLANLAGTVKSYGTQLKASAALVRLRLYQTLSLMPPESYEGVYAALLRELVAEFTLTDNTANTTTSLLRSMCHHDDSVILGSWLQETDYKAIEDQLQPNSASGSGALEHDPSCIYLGASEGESIPGPLPLGVTVIDKSVMLFGTVFPRVTHNKHRVQMLEHFMECIKQCKASRQEAVQMNIFTAFLAAMKGLAERKGTVGQDDVKKAAVQLILSALASSNPILRCAAGEALGRMAQVVGDNRFIADMAQYSFDKLKSSRDVISRTGHSLALGCLHKYVGGLGTGQHLTTSVSILLALAQDTTSPTVQVWSLHALGLIADSGGPMFRSYVEPTLSLCLTLLLTIPPSNVDVHQCLGKCLSALITTVGPELQANTSHVITARSSFLLACAIMQDHSDSLVQAEAIACLQQLHMFAPRHVNLTTLVPKLCATLSSSHLLLRRAAVACLRQLSQREAREVCEYAITLVDTNESKDWKIDITEFGLEGMLFAMLDTENDRQLISDIHDTLISMLQSLAGENLTRWLALCKQVLSASSEALLSPDEETGGTIVTEETQEDEDAGTVFKAGEEPESHPLVAPRWPTRVFAIECVRKIIGVCEENPQEAHFDLALARELKQKNPKLDFLVVHLSELVRMSFIAATSDSDQLRVAGLSALQYVIVKFAKVQEPEFPGHVILEQFQAQVGAALRPAFAADAGPNVTAAACEACSTWIGSGVARDLNDLRRVHQLLVSSLQKLKSGKASSSQQYSETAATMEKLAVLKAWAEVYVVAMNEEKEKKRLLKSHRNNDDDDEYEVESDYSSSPAKEESLLSLVSPELVSLSKHWLAALKDYALLSLPSEFSSQLPPEGGAFYNAETIETARPLYRQAWYAIVHAAALWLSNGGFENVSNEREDVDLKGGSNLGLGAANVTANQTPEEINTDRFHLILGICVEALCSSRTTQPVECITACLHATYQLLINQWPRSLIGKNQSLGIEVLNVMHRLLLTSEMSSQQQLVMLVVRQVVKAAQENLEWEKKEKAKERLDLAANQQPTPEDMAQLPMIGEGGDTGDIAPGKSLVFATLEVCLCLLVRHIPQLNPTLPNAPDQRWEVYLSDTASSLVASAVEMMAELPSLCSPPGSVSVLPTILFLTSGVLRFTAMKKPEPISVSPACASTLQSFKHLASSPQARDVCCASQWTTLLQSTLATLLDYAKSDSGVNWLGLDETVAMLALAIIVVSSPVDVVRVTNLQEPCVSIFRSALQSSHHLVQIKCLQTILPILQHPSTAVRTPYIHAVAPIVIEHLYAAAAANKVTLTETQVAVLSEEMNAMDALVNIADNIHKITLLKIFVPILISYLLEVRLASSSGRAAKLLHDQSLQRLMKIGPCYPEQFRTIMSSAPQLRARLEEAVKENQQKMAAKTSLSPVTKESAAPAIKLKMDFSNFSG